MVPVSVLNLAKLMKDGNFINTKGHVIGGSTSNHLSDSECTEEILGCLVVFIPSNTNLSKIIK